MANKPALTQYYPDDPSCSDFTLNCMSAWLQVDNPGGGDGIAVYVRKTSDGVMVQLYPNSNVMGDPISQASASFPEK